MFVTQTADATAAPLEVMQKDYGIFFDITNCTIHVAFSENWARPA